MCRSTGKCVSLWGQSAALALCCHCHCSCRSSGPGSRISVCGHWAPACRESWHCGSCPRSLKALELQQVIDPLPPTHPPRVPQRNPGFCLTEYIAGKQTTWREYALASQFGKDLLISSHNAPKIYASNITEVKWGMRLLEISAVSLGKSEESLYYWN